MATTEKSIASAYMQLVGVEVKYLQKFEKELMSEKDWEKLVNYGSKVCEAVKDIPGAQTMISYTFNKFSDYLAEVQNKIREGESAKQIA